MNEEKKIKFYNVAEISEIMGLSRSATYELVVSSECPFNVLRIGKRICVPANSFRKWYNSLAENNETATEEDT